MVTSNFICFGLLFITASINAATITYTYRDLGTLGGISSFATAINNRGWIAGTFTDSARVEHPFRYRPGAGMEQLSINRGRASGINESGVIVGMLTRRNGDEFGFVRAPGQAWEDIGGPPNPASPKETEALGINDAGQVVGITATADRPGGSAFLYTPGEGMTVVGAPLPGRSNRATDINNAGQVVGLSNGGGFLYTEEGGMDFFADGGQATAINNAGYITGGEDSIELDRYSAYLQSSDGTRTYIGALTPGGSAIGAGINNNNWIVGTDFSTQHAFLWKPGETMVDLNDLVAPFGGVMTSASDINDRGQIVGTAQFGNQMRAFLLNPIRSSAESMNSLAVLSTPEPASYLLIGVGVLVIAALRR